MCRGGCENVFDYERQDNIAMGGEEDTEERSKKKACARQKGNKYKKDKNEAQKTSSNSPSVAPTLSPTHGITIKSFVLFLQIFFRIADLQKKGKEGAERDSREMSKREEERKKGKRNGEKPEIKIISLSENDG